MATNYDVNYEDERFAKVEADKSQALSENEKTYNGMIENSDKYYDAQINASKEWADKQTQLQQEQTDFAIEQIEQQKEQAHKDYIKEQSGAYVDWQKQSDPYGVNAEKMAAQGLRNTGYSETSQVSMYNTYQNRVAAARESYSRAVLNYDNAMKDARLQNNAVLAEIAYTALQQQLELSLQGFQYKNQLILDKANKKTELENIFYGRYQDVLQQINTENALAEEVRQYNANLAEERRQYDANLALQKAQLEEEKRQFDAQQAAKAAAITKGGIAEATQNPPAATKRVTNTMDLGLGPVTQDYVAKLVAAGLIKATRGSDGKIYYQNTSGVTRQNADALLKLAGY